MGNFQAHIAGNIKPAERTSLFCLPRIIVGLIFFALSVPA
jgi:hypothetical protein